MTTYDEPDASDGHGGPHPLAGVPQQALDAATDMLLAGIKDGAIEDCPEALAHAILHAGLQAMRDAGTPAT